MSTLQKPHPIMIIAALSLIILSLAGVAAMMGWLPNSHSQTEAAGTAAESGNANTDASKGESRTGGTDHAGTRSHTVRKLAAAGARTEAPAPSRKTAATCADCGVVESVKVVEVEGKGTGLGAVAGGVLGGLVGNQIGQGRGNTVATVAGVAGGAYAGHEVEKNMKKTRRYDIVVRMQDGATRTFHQQTDPGLASGDKVRIENGAVVRE